MTEHKLSEKEMQEIKEEAEKLYPDVLIEERGIMELWEMYEHNDMQGYKRESCIAALTRERERVKGLEEAVKKLAQATSNLIQDVKNKPNDTRYATNTKAALVALDEYLTVFDNYKNNK